MKLVFGDFLPDLPDHGSPGVSNVINLYPSSTGFTPVGQWLPHTLALPSPCRGASAFVSDAGVETMIAGTSTNLYRQSNISWVAVASGFSLGASSRWRFVQFGNMAIATNGVDPLQKIDLTTYAATPLGGSPPTFQSLGVVSNFVVGSQMNGQVNAIAWSGENNAEWWTFAQRKSDYQEMADGGEVTGIVSGEVGLILQRNAVRRMAYVGGNVLFRFDKISATAGCASVHSVAQFGELAFWHSDSGFKMWDGAQITSIGFEKVDEAFVSRFGAVDYSTLSTAIDGQRGIVCWSTGRRIWIYNWLLAKWSVIEQTSQIITQRASRPPHLEEQDPVIGPPDDVVEGAAANFEDARFVGGNPSFYAFVDGASGTFCGVNMPASLTGRTVEPIDGRDARVRRIRPMTDATQGVTVRLEARQRLGDASTARDFSHIQTSGEMATRARGRFLKVSIHIGVGESWAYLQGVDATLEAGGRR